MLTVNLFDNTFRHDVCSVAGKVPRHLQYVRDRMEWDGITFFVDGCAGSKTLIESVSSPIKIGWLHEPPCLHPEDYANCYWDGLDLVMTYAEQFAGHPKAAYVPYGGIWIPRAEWGMHGKSKPCSMLIGSKKQTEGHRLRHAIADAVAPFGKVDFYGVRGEPVGYGWETKLKVLKDYAFTIVAEACRENGLFTEILLDCLAMGTIPIFWGCPNLEHFFLHDGILCFETVAECVECVQEISFDYYREMMSAAATNLQMAAQYEITEDWIYDHVLQVRGLA